MLFGGMAFNDPLPSEFTEAPLEDQLAYRNARETAENNLRVDGINKGNLKATKDRDAAAEMASEAGIGLKAGDSAMAAGKMIGDAFVNMEKTKTEAARSHNAYLTSVEVEKTKRKDIMERGLTDRAKADAAVQISKNESKVKIIQAKASKEIKEIEMRGRVSEAAIKREGQMRIALAALAQRGWERGSHISL